MALRIFFADSPSIGSKLVKLFTGGKWSHCGFYDPKTDTVIDSLQSKDGVSEYSLSSLLKHFSKVEIYRFDEFSDKGLTRARAELGKPYDWSAIFSWFSNRHWLRDDKWYCSELVFSVVSEDPAFILDSVMFLQTVSLNKVSPQDLYDLLPIHTAKRL